MSRSSVLAMNDLLHAFDEVIAQLPEARRKALDAAGKSVLSQVRRQIDTRLNDAHGRVKSWQEVTMGSGGGWARVSSKAESIPGKDWTTKDITFWLEHGHEVAVRGRNQYGKFSRYENRKALYSESAGKMIVSGRLFYSWAKDSAQREAKNAAEQVLQQLANELEDLVAGQTTMEGWL